jgi:hypothetical protein
MVELMNANAVLNPNEQAIRALAYAEGEAIIRFPEAFDATKWRWDRAYNLLRVRDPLSLNLYGKLITDGITSGQTRVSDLSSWFSIYENRLTLRISPLPPQPGELSRELVEIIGSGTE